MAGDGSKFLAGIGKFR